MSGDGEEEVGCHLFGGKGTVSERRGSADGTQVTIDPDVGNGLVRGRDPQVVQDSARHHRDPVRANYYQYTAPVVQGQSGGQRAFYG